MSVSFNPGNNTTSPTGSHFDHKEPPTPPSNTTTVSVDPIVPSSLNENPLPEVVVHNPSPPLQRTTNQGASLKGSSLDTKMIAQRAREERTLTFDGPLRLGTYGTTHADSMVSGEFPRAFENGRWTAQFPEDWQDDEKLLQQMDALTQLSDADVAKQFADEFLMLSGRFGQPFLDGFLNGNGDELRVEATSSNQSLRDVSDMLWNSSQAKDLQKNVEERFKSALKKQYEETGTIDPSKIAIPLGNDDRPNYKPGLAALLSIGDSLLGGHLPGDVSAPLPAIFGGTDQITVTARDVTFDPETGDYSAKLTVELRDDFAVDSGDTYTRGLRAMWALQKQRGRKPFTIVAPTTIDVSGNVKQGSGLRWPWQN